MNKLTLALICIIVAAVLIALASPIEVTVNQAQNTAIPMPQYARMPKVKNNT